MKRKIKKLIQQRQIRLRQSMLPYFLQFLYLLQNRHFHLDLLNHWLQMQIQKLLHWRRMQLKMLRMRLWMMLMQEHWSPLKRLKKLQQRVMI